METINKNSPLVEVQNTLFEMMVAVHNICEEENIQYWISDGSLLGSVRHKGFIPWDDDADFGMLREDYNRFLQVVNKLPKKFKIETEELNTHGKHNWLKIMYLDDFEWIDWHGIQRKGISMDIFPYDYVPVSNKKTTIEKLVHRVASILYPAEVKSTKNRLQRLINKSKIHNLYSKFNKETNYITYGIETPYFGDAYYKKDEIFPLKKSEFENFLFYAPKNADYCLTTLYGDDYMELPEESKRVSHMENLRFTSTNS